jgi:hypothetical protein
MSDKLKKLVGLLFFIQHLNSKLKIGRKPIDKPENRSVFYIFSKF